MNTYNDRGDGHYDNNDDNLGWKDSFVIPDLPISV